MKTSKTVAKLLFVVGALVYLVGLWISCPLLSGKGYFLGVLMTATFGNYAYLRAEKLGQLDNFFTHICQLVALITIGVHLYCHRMLKAALYPGCVRFHADGHGDLSHRLFCLLVWSNAFVSLGMSNIKLLHIQE